MATNSAFIVIFKVISLVLLSACTHQQTLSVESERVNAAAFSEHLRSGGYDWYNTNVEGNTVHFATSGARYEEGLVFVKMSTFYKKKQTTPCGPLGDTTPRQYEDYAVSLNPETNVASIYGMDGYMGYSKICHEHLNDPIRTTYNSKSVFALWLEYWRKTNQVGSLSNTSHSESSSGIGIESLIKGK